MPFSVTIARTFCAAHALRLPGGELEPIHGHNWQVRVTVARDDGGLDDVECVVDFHVLEERLDAVLEPWRNANLNDIPPFDAAVNPTAERVAEQVGRQLQLPEGVRAVEVTITEAEGCLARWAP